MIDLDDIRQFFRGHIALSQPLSDYTSFRVGGPADFFLEPVDRDDVLKLVAYLRQQHLPFILLGKGSNMLVSDEGFRGAVISLESGLRSMRTDGGMVFADAGITLVRFVDFCIQRGFRGVEMLAGIPGTVGGAVIMNAGAYGGEISDHLFDVEVIRDGRIIRVPKREAGFSYRRSGFEGDVVLGASFRLPPGEKAALMQVRRELLLRRNRAQPINMPNSGSMFKNPPGAHAAELIDQAGLKGTTRGHAQISERHANFIVNLGGARAADILELVELVKARVREKFSVELELEVRLVGFRTATPQETGP